MFRRAAITLGIGPHSRSLCACCVGLSDLLLLEKSRCRCSRCTLMLLDTDVIELV